MNLQVVTSAMTVHRSLALHYMSHPACFPPSMTIQANSLRYQSTSSVLMLRFVRVGLMILLLLAVQRTTDYYARLFAVIWVDLVSIVYRTCIYDRDT